MMTDMKPMMDRRRSVQPYYESKRDRVWRALCGASLIVGFAGGAVVTLALINLGG